MNKIKQTSSDKIKGKLVKYRQGDCLSIECNNGKYLGVLTSNKFNKYYDLTVIDFYEPHKPVLTDFFSGKFFGTRFGSWEDLEELSIRIEKSKNAERFPDLAFLSKHLVDFKHIVE
ncbi:hypothetical protein WG954_18050 [Lacibacter sp. H375]|uniref:hypothetical protein n=1 Tax=Lacibacter sp. H375 TaxID=3133424 RepID=UPI0030BA7883